MGPGPTWSSRFSSKQIGTHRFPYQRVSVCASNISQRSYASKSESDGDKPGICAPTTDLEFRSLESAESDAQTTRT